MSHDSRQYRWNEQDNEQESVGAVQLTEGTKVEVSAARWKKGPWKVALTSTTVSRGQEFTSNKFPRMSPEAVRELLPLLEQAAQLVEEKNSVVADVSQDS